MIVTASIFALLVGGAIASPCASGASGGKDAVVIVPMTQTEWDSRSTSPISFVSSTGIPIKVGNGWVDFPGSKATVVTEGSSESSTTSGAISSPTSDSYIKYSAVGGYFVQDDNATQPDGFDYALVNFGLINQTYDTDFNASLTQWERFAVKLADLQDRAPNNVQYKLVFMGRHGEGNHNAMESYVGTPAWNCYWALLNGANSSFIYADASVTEEGISQAEKASAYWASRIAEQKIPFIQSYYSSPMRRCLETAQFTYTGLDLPKEHPFIPTIKEGLREGMSEHTCNRRSTRSWIEENYPDFLFEAGFTEQDELWTGSTTEVPSAQDFRSKTMLDDIFSSDDNTYLSFTSHSGEIASILRVIGHRDFRLGTGQIIPALIKAETISPDSATSTISSGLWTPSPFCTEPPVTSISAWGSGGGCVCQSSAEPVITELPPFPTSAPTPPP